jgi:hypothetical protein
MAITVILTDEKTESLTQNRVSEAMHWKSVIECDLTRLFQMILTVSDDVLSDIIELLQDLQVTVFHLW